MRQRSQGVRPVGPGVSERRALVVGTPSALASQASGASLRLADVRAVLQRAGYEVTVVDRAGAAGAGAGWDVGVAVSYVSAGCLRDLAVRARRTWLDTVDSWLLVDGTGLRAGHPSYAARAVRDAVRLARAPRPGLVTWISDADRRSDRGTVRGDLRLVLPGSSHVPSLGAAGDPRLVLVGDWSYTPNRDALAWLRRSVLPRLPVPVHVYGRGVKSVDDGRLVVHGHVARESELYRPTDVHLAPVLHGGGVKRKVLQPLLLGLQVVATPAAAHGLRAHPRLHVRAHGADFAAACGDLLGADASAPASPAELYDCDDTGEVLRWLKQP